jgi:hypothetical protein
MTYNFDPEKWYDNEKSLLEKRLSDGEIGREEFDKELDALDARLEEMWKRLDGTFRLPE